MRVAEPIVLEGEIRRSLERQARGRSTAARVVMRSRIVLSAADGLQSNEIAAQMGSRHVLWLCGEGAFSNWGSTDY